MLQRLHIAPLLFLLCATNLGAQRQIWQIGGSSSSWSDNDSSQVFIDFDSAPGSIQPVYIDSAKSLFSLLEGWRPLKGQVYRQPVDGSRPAVGGQGSGGLLCHVR